jgi:hypothetical protein
VGPGFDSGSMTDARAFSSPPFGFLQFLPVAVALYLIAAGRSRRTSAAALVLALITVACYMATRTLSGFGVGTSTEYPSP